MTKNLSYLYADNRRDMILNKSKCFEKYLILNAVSDHSAFAMRHTITYLRSIMSQQGLNHCVILQFQVHKEATDSRIISLNDIVNDFINNENSERAYGHFTGKD